MTLSILGSTATAWLWDKFGGDFAQKLAKDIWATFSWAVAAKRYREHLHKQYSTIHIFGMSEPVPLEGVFTHVVALDKPADRHSYDITALQEEVLSDPDRIHALMRQRIYGKTERIDGCDLVRDRKNDRLFILGKPGGGKTTFLKYLALQAAREDLNQIPIFVTLREWQAEGDLLAFLARQFEICGFPEAAPFIQLMLQHTDFGLVLFDGLDEVPQEGERRDRAIAALRDFARQYPRAQVLITCRNAASDVTFEGFKFVEIADFQEGQMHAFVRKWFRAAKAPEVAEQFWKALNEDENRGIRELGSQPLLLTLLCLTYQETLHFPQRRVEIYEEALEALLKKWDSSRQIARDSVYKNLSLGRKRQLFARLAATFFDKGFYFIPQHDLVQAITDYMQGLPPVGKEHRGEIDGTVILQEIEAQHGILVQCAQRIYTFTHLTFQEYYTARYVAENTQRGALKRLLIHVHEARWHEVILLVASMLYDTEDFFSEFQQALDIMVRDEPALTEFLSWAQHKAAAVDAPYKLTDVRGYYTYLALYLTRTLNRTITRILGGYRPHNLDRAINHAFALIRTLDHALDQTLVITYARTHDLPAALDDDRNYSLDRVSSYTLNLAFDLAFTFALTLIRDHIRDIALDPEIALVLARDRVISFPLFGFICYHAENLGLEPLYKVLAALDIPATNAPLETWQAFESQLQSIMIEHRDLGHDWDFTQEEAEMLNRYYTAAHLLKECLNVAYVTDRAAIEDRLLLPPK